MQISGMLGSLASKVGFATDGKCEHRVPRYFMPLSCCHVDATESKLKSIFACVPMWAAVIRGSPLLCKAAGHLVV